MIESHDFFVCLHYKLMLSVFSSSSAMYAVITFQDTDEVMVAASNWLNTDKTQCHWPPFRSEERSLRAVKYRTEPSTGGKPWKMLNIIIHAEYGNTICFNIIHRTILCFIISNTTKCISFCRHLCGC